jgi:phosphoribosylglycinamide formyltransferase-1
MHPLLSELYPRMKQIAIFASGAGSNAREIIRHFKSHDTINVSLVFCNKPGAGVISLAEHAGIPVHIIEKDQFFQGDAYIPELQQAKINLIVLAGFLWKIPVALTDAFKGRIMNIHPALLPKYGGKGMYGHHVHEAVIASGDQTSGITIHLVDEVYDHGEIIFQTMVDISKEDTPESLASKIHVLEHKYYPSVIEKFLENKNPC